MHKFPFDLNGCIYSAISTSDNSLVGVVAKSVLCTVGSCVKMFYKYVFFCIFFQEYLNRINSLNLIKSTALLHFFHSPILHDTHIIHTLMFLINNLFFVLFWKVSEFENTRNAVVAKPFEGFCEVK